MTLEHLDTALGFAVIMLLLSLLITVLVQTVTAVLGLRGSNLRWGVAQLLAQIDPSLVDHAKAIAERALRHSAIAPIWKRRATAIRPDELIRVLDQMSAADAWGGSKTTGEDKQALEAARNALRAVAAKAGSGPTPELGERAAAVAASAAQLFPARAEAVKQAVLDALGSTRTLAAGVNSWFNTVMDRTTERFVAQARWVTAITALAFSFVLRIDSLQLWQRLSTDSEFRAKLVSASEGTLRKAEEVVALTAERKAVASTAIAATRDQLSGTPVAASLGEVPTQLVTRQQGEAWLRDHLKGTSDRDSVLSTYNSQFDQATKSWLGELRNSTTSVNEQLQQASFQLIPTPYPPFGGYVTDLRHLAGTLVTVLLLSLGAPFWFNLLRQMANLRPAIAEKVAGGTAKGAA